MTSGSFKSEVEEFSKNVYERYMRLMPADDLTLIVLKGHLLVEEQMNKFIEACMMDEAAEVFAKLKLSFRWKLRFARKLHRPKAGYPSAGDTFASVWKAVDELNNLRNDIAHNAEVNGLEQRCAEFVNKRGPQPATDMGADAPSRLKVAIGDIVAAVAGYRFAREVGVGKRHITL
jgi:hypothetical protein